MKYHFIGICGAGMSAVAKLLIDSGHTVTGSDEGFYAPISEYLDKQHISCLSPYKKQNIPTDVDCIVVGKHAKLTQETNEEVAFAFTLGKPILSFPEVLEKITDERERIVVAGSFGKSSCSALMAWILSENNIDAGYFIGAVPITPKENAHVGTAKEFVFEGDEYPSLNWDSTSKFLYYHPHHILLTALAHDHINIFKTHEEYITPFIKLFSTQEASGLAMICTDDETVKKNLLVIQSNHQRVTTYGLHSGSTWSARDIHYDEMTTFILTKNNNKVAEISTTLLGAHNIQNIIGVSALLLETKKISADQLTQSVATFKGIVRRLDKKSDKTRIPVFEGFGSSIDKAKSAISAIQLHFSERKLFIIFEPHTFSWRDRSAIAWYDTVFSGGDSVLIYKPPEYREELPDQLTLDEICERTKKTNIKTFKAPTIEDARLALQNIQEDSVVLILSSGGMDGLIQDTVNFLESKFPRI